MLCLTKIKRSYVIEHVMPSDLDDKDIKHGLYLKEKMIQEITDDYIKQNYPNWKEIERSYRKNGLTDICDKLMCGEMDQNDIVKPKSVRTEVWMRYKEFKKGTIISNVIGYYYNEKFYSDMNHTEEIQGEVGKIYMDITIVDDKPINQPYVYVLNDTTEKYFFMEYYGRYQAYDFDRMDGYCDWIKSDENNIFHLSQIGDVMIQFQLVIIGENAIRYYPFQDMSHYSGFDFVQNELEIYDPQTWDRESTSLLSHEISAQEEYYRFFFKNYKGYYNFKFEDDYDEWIEANYPNEKEVRTLQSDPFRIKSVRR